MDLTASWAGDLGVFRHLFFVVVGHPFQESCKRRTAVLAKVVSVLIGHSCSLTPVEIIGLTWEGFRLENCQSSQYIVSSAQVTARVG